MRRDAFIWIVVLACSACRSAPEPAPGAALIDVSNGPAPSTYRAIGPVACRVEGTGAGASDQCRVSLQSAAHELDADLVVLEQSPVDAPCVGCTRLRGTAYRRQLAYDRAKPTAGSPTFSKSASISGIATGTAFVVSPDGVLLTALHVVDGARTLIITSATGTQSVATVMSRMDSSDMALLHVPLPTSSYISLGDAQAVEVGQRVFTLGFPVTSFLGVEPKFADGSISARSGLTGGAEAFQITVPVQPGNSGGPLVTEDGLVVGVVSSTAAILPFYRATGVMPQGISWAVKSDVARKLFSQPPPLPPASSRHDAIRRATDALCFVEAVNGDGLLLAPKHFGEAEVQAAPSGFDGSRRECAHGDTEACLATAMAIARACIDAHPPACPDARYAGTMLVHACAVGRSEACKVLRDGPRKMSGHPTTL